MFVACVCGSRVCGEDQNFVTSDTQSLGKPRSYSPLRVSLASLTLCLFVFCEVCAAISKQSLLAAPSLKPPRLAQC